MNNLQNNSARYIKDFISFQWNFLSEAVNDLHLPSHAYAKNS